MSARAWAVAAIAAAAVLMGVVAAAPAGSAGPGSGVTIIGAQIGGNSLFGDTRSHPVPLRPNTAPFSITFRHDGDAPIRLRYIRFDGGLLGGPLVRFQAATRFTIPAGTTSTLSQEADFFDINHAASGFVDAKIEAVDERGRTVASHSFAADVKGRIWSTEGLFLLEVIAFALIGAVQILVGTARRSLPRNRFVRGVLYGVTTGSASIAVVIAIAMLRIGLPQATTWLPVALLMTVSGFALGYVSPGPLERRAHEASEEKILDLVATEAVARASGQHERRTTGESVPHTSGEHAAAVSAHESGEFSRQHESGEFSPQHDSGAVDPVE
jgi:hypothetical protein